MASGSIAMLIEHAPGITCWAAAISRMMASARDLPRNRGQAVKQRPTGHALEIGDRTAGDHVRFPLQDLVAVLDGGTSQFTA